MDKFAIVYLNDIIIYSKTKEEYLKHIEKVFKALFNHRLYVKPLKCIIDVKILKLCRHVVRSSIVTLVASKVKVIDK